MPCFFAASVTGDLSASRRILTICSSVNRLFFMGSSPGGGSHSLKLSVGRKIRAGHPFFANLPACPVGIEACASADHWARKLQTPGRKFRLLAA